jgi:mannose-6-phosphate isomerase-like protein (cupin superfamily)
MTGSPGAWWFLDTLVLEHQVGSKDEPVVLEQMLPVGAAPPLHCHHQYEDNWYLLEGTIVIRCGDRSYVVGPGSFVRTPMAVPHSFRVMGDGPARILLVHASDHFQQFIRALAVPAERLEIPEPTGGPGLERLTAAAAAHDTEILGESLTDDEAAVVLEASRDGFAGS